MTPGNLGVTSPYTNVIPTMAPSGMVWVKNKTEAMNYPMARGTTLPIFDQNEDDIFYVKSVDVYGNTQPLRVFKYEEIVQPVEVSSEGVSTEEFNSLKEEIAGLKEELKKALSSQNNDYKKNNYRKENRNNG